MFSLGGREARVVLVVVAPGCERLPCCRHPTILAIKVRAALDPPRSQGRLVLGGGACLTVAACRALHGLGVGEALAVSGSRCSPISRMQDPDAFRRQTRDLYVPPGDVGFWQGAIRDRADDAYAGVLGAVEARRRLTIDLLYSDHEGGQRVISRFGVLPRADTGWRCSIVRHWNLDRQDPRSVSVPAGTLADQRAD